MKLVCLMVALTASVAAHSAMPSDARATSQPGDRLLNWPGDREALFVHDIAWDGRLASYANRANWDLYLRHLDTGQVRRLTRFELQGGSVAGSAISRRGTHIAYLANLRDKSRRGLQVMSLASPATEGPRSIRRGGWIEPLEWSSDDRHLLVRTVGEPSHPGLGIGLLDLSDGRLRMVKSNADWSIENPRLAPNGRFIAYDYPAADMRLERDVYLLPVAGGPEVRIEDPGASDTVIGWSADSRTLIVQSDRSGSTGVWSIAIDDSGSADAPRLVTENLSGRPVRLTGAGDLVYRAPQRTQATGVFSVEITPRSATATPKQEVPDRRFAAVLPRWSADGRAFAYIVLRPTGLHLEIRSDRETRQIRLQFRQVANFDWSPDREWFVFCGAFGSRGNLGTVLLNAATGEHRQLRPGAESRNATGFSETQCQFSRDGRSVQLFKVEQLKPRRVSYVAVDIESGHETVIHESLDGLLVSSARPCCFGAGRMPAGSSPDGRYLLAVQIGEPTSALYAHDTMTGRTREVFRINRRFVFNPSGVVTWMPDSRAVIANVASEFRQRQELWRIPLDGRPAVRISAGMTLMTGGPVAVHPDGTRIAFVGGHWGNPQIPDPSMIGAGVEFRVLERLLGEPSNR